MSPEQTLTEDHSAYPYFELQQAVYKRTFSQQLGKSAAARWLPLCSRDPVQHALAITCRLSLKKCPASLVSLENPDFAEP